MSNKNLPRLKYTDLLPFQSDYELELMINDLDQLCTSKQPPLALVNLDIVRSLQARQAESVALPPSLHRQFLGTLAQNLSFRGWHRRLSLKQKIVLRGFIFLVVVLTVAFAIVRSTIAPKHGEVANAVVKPVCANFVNKPGLPNGSGPMNSCGTFSNQKASSTFLNQSDVVNGTKLTLQKAIVTPTYTSFYLEGVGSDFDFELRAGDFYLDSTNNDTGKLNQPVQIAITTDGLTQLTLNAALLDKTGEWTLIIKTHPTDKGQNQTVGGPWVFRFTPSATP